MSGQPGKVLNATLVYDPEGRAVGATTRCTCSVVDPWGEIKAMLPEGEGVITGVLDAAFLAGVRERLPALKHRKL